MHPLLAERWARAAEVVAATGHPRVPVMVQRVLDQGINPSLFPYECVTVDGWQRLIQAYAVNDCSCSVEGCEPVRGEKGSSKDRI